MVRSSGPSIITTDANAPMRAVHDRMPVILEPEDWTAWLEGPNPGALPKPAADNVLHLWPISRGG
ncbi:MAG: SOS response-associated peptidase family protein [Acetobacteraceae bacterium]|nr:SOS response-associated peptidase family protein [Acetobacteraceae bacterium]